jgi:IS30 family transposase
MKLYSLYVRTPFNGITDGDLADIADKLNNRPRKSLDYATLDEVFSSF